ncbi:hypothetical protein ASD74_24110 [Rhizobium sp. Root564]|nr:hypothetical protein ASD74_24110 [Rhizobium sp. Root564]
MGAIRLDFGRRHAVQKIHGHVPVLYRRSKDLALQIIHLGIPSNPDDHSSPWSFRAWGNLPLHTGLVRQGIRKFGKASLHAKAIAQATVAILLLSGHGGLPIRGLAAKKLGKAVSQGDCITTIKPCKKVRLGLRPVLRLVDENGVEA